jgi:hypothetical protein
MMIPRGGRGVNAKFLCESEIGGLFLPGELPVKRLEDSHALFLRPIELTPSASTSSMRTTAPRSIVVLPLGRLDASGVAATVGVGRDAARARMGQFMALAR